MLAGTQLTGNTLYSGGKISDSTFGLLNTSLYCCTVLVWLVYAAKKAASPNHAATALVSQRWEEGLGDLQTPAPADSLIPMFERMVDRALSRNAQDHERLEYQTRKQRTAREVEPPASVSGTSRH